MKRFRSLIALALSLALVVLSPGSSAYHAAAQTMSAANGSAATGISGVSGANLGRTNGVNSIPALGPSNLNLSSVLSAPSITPSALANPAVIPAASVPALVGANVAVVPAALKASAPAAAKAVVPTVKASAPAKTISFVETLKSNLSAPSIADKPAEMQAAEARKQFDGETLKSDLSAPAVSGKGSETRGSNLKAAKKAVTPDGDVDALGNPVQENGPIDGLGNVSRGGDNNGPDSRGGDNDGPDSRGDGNERGGSGLFGMFGIGLLGGGAAVAAGLTLGAIASIPMILLSLVLHEIGHARMADKLGDPTSRLQNRASFNPRHWMTHIDPVWTLLIPAISFITTGMIFGGARPVPVEPRYFKNPVKGMALVALAGPAVNLGLAVAGALAVTGAVAAGLGAGVIATLASFVFLNALLAIFNMIPLPPLDGSHILKAFLPPQASAAMDGFMAKLGPMGMMLPMIIIFMMAGGAIAGAAMFIAKFLIGGAMAITGISMASAFLPALAALGLAVGQLGAAAGEGKKAAAEAVVPGPSGPNNGGASASGSGPRSVDLIVMFGEKKTKLHDAHISNVDVNLPNGVEQYTRLQQAMLAQLETAGLDSSSLEPYKGTPLATYARINAATIRVEGAAVAEFTKDMAARGFAVYANTERKIITPVPVTPEQMDPEIRGGVTMDENLKITKADAVQAEAAKKWGKPELGFWSGLWAKVFKSEAPQPKFGVIDSGADVSHPLLKRVKEVKNMTSGENVDDIGHGTWVHSTVLHMAPWSRNTTHYKTFLNGGATLDDILKSLTLAGNDGNLVISNSWGSDDGDPKSPDSLLVEKLASEGHIMVFAAGNAGSGKNTIGSPAIVTYKDATTGAIRVVSVAAAGRDKKVAYFSSRGPGSPISAKIPGYPHRPDLTAVGYNIEGAWPAELGGADRVDGEKGSVKAISGTSMSTPGVAGAIALLAMMFGVTEKGVKLDAVVNAVMATLEKTGKNSYDEEGEGFLNVTAAYERLVAEFFPGSTPPNVVARYRALIDSEKSFTSGSEMSLRVSKRIAGEKADILARYPDVAYHAAGFFARMRMKAPVAADVAAFRALKSRLNTLYFFVSTSADTAIVASKEYHEALDEIKQLNDRIAALKAADNTLAYRAAGPIKRFILNATGAAPKP